MWWLSKLQDGLLGWCIGKVQLLGKVGSSAACSWQVCRLGANVCVVMDGKHCHIRVKGEEWLEDKVGVDNVKDD